MSCEYSEPKTHHPKPQASEATVLANGYPLEPVSYVVFARKYRPLTFNEVVGQEHVAQTLRNAIDGDRLAHAYLFCGPRGVGKTTMARILAKAVNCQATEGADPCGKCEVCTSIATGQDIDVLELDAASRRKVEDIEPLIDSSRYLPQRSPRKIFIVDEAHMLSKTAWNALLKTLEEPPAHVMFIFATTEPSKVIETVRSRCQRFDFKRITEKDIVGKLQRIATAEGAQVDPEVFDEIAARATGGMRDAETLLDQALGAAPSDRALRSEDLVAILGGTPRGERTRILTAAYGGEMREVLTSAATLVDAGADPVELLQELFDDLHETAVRRASGQPARPGLEPIGIEWCLAAADLLSRHRYTARESRAARASLDLGLLAVTRLGDVRDLEEMVERLESIAGDSAPSGSKIAPTSPSPVAPSSRASAPSAGHSAPASPKPVAAPSSRASAPSEAHIAQSSPPPVAAASFRVSAPAAAHSAPASPPPVAAASSRVSAPAAAHSAPASPPPVAAPEPVPERPAEASGRGRLSLPGAPTRPQPPQAAAPRPPQTESPAAPAPAAEPKQGGFTSEEMGRIRSHPRVKEVLDAFRGRIEAVKRTNPSEGGE